MNPDSESASHEAVLDLLGFGPTSFAALYRWLRVENGIDTDTERLWSIVGQLRTSGDVDVRRMLPSGRWVTPSDDEIEVCLARYRAWLDRLPEITLDDTSFDMVGLWVYAKDERAATR